MLVDNGRKRAGGADRVGVARPPSLGRAGGRGREERATPARDRQGKGEKSQRTHRGVQDPAVARLGEGVEP